MEKPAMYQPNAKPTWFSKQRRTPMEGSNQVQIDIENPYTPLATWMRYELDNLSPKPLLDCCIYRVPDRLRCVNEKVFTPQVISIGPLHHGKESLKAMEDQKQKYLKGFLRRTKVELEVYVKIIKNCEARLRSCYGETIEFSSDEFVRIILVDALFIIELFLRFCGRKFHIAGVGNQESDRILNKPWMIHYVAPDLQLLENQVPFFILHDLFDPETVSVSCNGANSTTSNETKSLSMISLAYEFLTITLEQEGTEDCLKTLSSSSDPISKVHHLLDFIRTLHLPTSEEAYRSSEGSGDSLNIAAPSIMKLHRSGVKFKLGSSKNLFDIQFRDGVLEIPKLKIHDDTELTLRNLLAFEQCHCDGNYISDYVSLMDDLVNIPKDVEFLVHDGIVEHMLGDDSEVCTLINNLGRGITMDRQHFYFATLAQRLNDYCRKPWNQWKANLRQNYFNTPWATISVIAAVFLLVLTCIQAACAIISVMPSKRQNS